METPERAPLKIGVPPQSRVLKIGRSYTETPAHGQWEKTEATRYLCASAYLSRTFRSRVIRYFIENKHNALAVSYGIDPVTVLKHSLSARRIGRTRDLLLLIPVFLALLGLLSAVVAGPAAIFLYPLLLGVALVAAFCIIAWEQWENEFHIVRQNFSKKQFDPGALLRGFDPETEQVFREVEEAQKANVMIYAAFSPFVGCGNNIGSWSVPVDLAKGKEDVGGYLQPKTVQIKELYDEITRTLRGLEFPNCSIEDKLCTSGLDIRGNDKFLPDLMGRPCTRIEPAAMEEYITHPSSQARHYQSFRLVDWSGELILSAFLRAAKTGHNLFVEVSYCLLVPLDAEYRRVDSMNPVPGWRDWLRLLAVSFVKCVLIWPVWLAYIWELAVHPLHTWLHEREVRNMIRENPAFNHGAATSLREMTCKSYLYRHYFQKLDQEMYLKTLERQILDCIVRFLDDRNIDTSALKEARTSIINSGIILSGGSSVGANILAVGRGSTAVSQGAGTGAVKFMERLTRGGAGGQR
ncbi:MAG TPA: hypothetical protein VIX14_11180 [Terriglobales bacterium]